MKCQLFLDYQQMLFSVENNVQIYTCAYVVCPCSNERRIRSECNCFACNLSKHPFYVDLIEMKRQRNLTIVFPADCENNKY